MILKIQHMQKAGRHAQMEIMGLAVIMILVSLGMLFIIQFNLNKEPSTLKKTFTQTQLASNILGSFLRTTADACAGNSIGELLKDCAENYNTPNTQLRCDANERSCDYTRETIASMFNSTLIAWGNQSYYFEARIPGQPLMKSFNGRCTGEKESKQNYIPTDAGTLTIVLDICS
ncbi:hypothetical protein HYV81_03820 [Candidatus Woesearchaeota archaeon]|nr:hypothetical protein [Candidatus Woesearchaeota archaeon]